LAIEEPKDIYNHQSSINNNQSSLNHQSIV